jgi:AAA domain, putative AbiEii toxin, Type IV TA system
VFRLVDRADAASNGNEVLLVTDRWNDWYTWITQFYAIVVASDGTRTDIGQVKIARIGMTKQTAQTQLPPTFAALNMDWFSMGQSENYYETLNTLGPQYRNWFLSALQDCARDLALLDRHADEEVLSQSLLRDIDSDRVRNRFHRLALGDAALTGFAFQFEFPVDPRAVDEPPTITFRVTPSSHPPSNIHVVIGRNGVGKSRCFDFLARAFLGRDAPRGGSPGTLSPLGISPSFLGRNHGFAGLVAVSFSPFDKYGPLVSNPDGLDVRYAYVGLIRESAEARENGQDPNADAAPLTIKAQPDLFKDFRNGIVACRIGARRDRWAHALERLEADPLFKEAGISEIVGDEQDGWEDRAWRLFRNLSSGHCIVLLIITKLVELVEEKSLVLIDEPEGHLHPPLLSAFVRALSELLIDRNGVAIVATHSPVVLQEVPKTCAWILNRSGLSSRADRPRHETFGENVGTLTHEVFGLEVMQTGFYRLISEAVETRTYAQVVDHFGGQLGGEARALARTLTLLPPEGDADDALDF